MDIQTGIYSIVDLPDTHDFSDMEFSKGMGDAHGILNEQGEYVAYAWYSVNDGFLYMHMIEVLEKEQGHGTAIVKHLFNALNVNQINGVILEDMSFRPYYFWLSLGSTLDVDNEDEFMDCYYQGQDVNFELKKENLLV